MRRLAAAVLAAVLAAGACGPDATEPEGSGRFQGVEVLAPSPRPQFTLTDTSGRPFDFGAETAGMITFLYFGYTSCPDICPVHLANIDNALQVRPDLAVRTRVVMVTVDPARDTPEVLRAYLDRFDPRFVGLVGTPEEVEAAQRAAGVAVAVAEVDENGTPNGLVGHAAQVLGYGPDDLLHVAFPFGTRASAYAHDLAVLADLAPVRP